MLSLLRLDLKQKILQIHFEFASFSFYFHSFGIETINTFIHSRKSLENHTRVQTKMGKVYTSYTRFQTNSAQIPCPTGRHIQYLAYIREYPSPQDPVFYNYVKRQLHTTSCNEPIVYWTVTESFIELRLLHFSVHFVVFWNRETVFEFQLQ